MRWTGWLIDPRLLVGEAVAAAGLAVLGEDELAADQPSGPCLAQLAQLTGKLAVGVGVQPEAACGVFHHVGRVGEHRPPVAGRAGLGARFGHRIAVAEQALVHRHHGRGGDLGTRDLAESRHVATVCSPVGDA